MKRAIDSASQRKLERLPVRGTGRNGGKFSPERKLASRGKVLAARTLAKEKREGRSLKDL